MGLEDYDRVEVRSRDELRSWLADHHEQDEGVWLVTWKAHTEHYLPWGEMVQELLAWGWIDSTTRRLDEDRTSRLVTPRRAGSVWSRVNKEHVEELEASGRMTDAGRAVIEAAKADGSWSSLDEVEQGIVPDDLAAALDDLDARDQFDALPWSTRRATLAWVTMAKREATRARRVEQAARVTAEGGRPQ